MRLNKQAAWGVLPLPGATSPPGPNTLRKTLTESPLSAQLDALKKSIDASNPIVSINALAKTLEPLATVPQAVLAAGAGTQSALEGVQQAVKDLAATVRQGAGTVRTPSTSAFRILARLGQVRDALCDLKKPSLETTNKRLEAERTAADTQQLHAEIAARYPELGTGFIDQFRHLTTDGRPFEGQRRERLAELMSFEARIAASVVDGAEPPPDVLQPRPDTRKS